MDNPGHNRAEFTHWLRYEAESTIVFGDAPAAAAKSALGSRNARVGDRIAATVHKEARWKGGVIVPASRIRSIEKPADGNFTLAMEFAELQNGESQGFFARLTEVTSASGDRRMKDEGLPGVATLQIAFRASFI